MYQVLQNIATGETILAEVAEPGVLPGSVKIASNRSLISSGTERMLIEFGQASWVNKARLQPDKVREVIAKAKTDGVLATVDVVRNKLDQPMALGYSNAGVVVEKAEDVTAFEIGDRVVCNGPHAEIVNVPVNLCARIPANVNFETAAYTVPGAIALQGIRLAEPTLGEMFVVTGLGLIGLLAVKLLKATGCHVLGIDPDSERRHLAQKYGAQVADPDAEDLIGVSERFSRYRGVDGVIIAASTQSNEPITQGARMCRKRGRVVLVGVAGLKLSRSDFYEKELSFRVSCSYGPGRYDSRYEEQGHDYPVGFVRWTENRNFEAVLDMMSEGSLELSEMTTHRFPIERALEGYRTLQEGKPHLGILLEYSDRFSGQPVDNAKRGVKLPAYEGAVRRHVAANSSIAVVGAGNYSGRVLMPAFKAAGANLKWVVANTGVGPAHYGKKFGFIMAGTDVGSAIADPDVNVVVIATRHDSHANLVCQALRAGKHVFVEKPLAITNEQLRDVEYEYIAQIENGQKPIVMIGFNRRFAPLTLKMKALIDDLDCQKAFVITVNAGHIPRDHWIQDPKVGGGRIVGEACHFIDLIRFLAGSSIVGAKKYSITRNGTTGEDISSLQLKLKDGSVGTIHYLSNGHKSFPKERIEVFSGGRVLQLDNFRLLKGWGWNRFRQRRLWRQDKGQQACVNAFVDCIEGRRSEAPILFEEIMEVSGVSIELGTDDR